MHYNQNQFPERHLRESHPRPKYKRPGKLIQKAIEKKVPQPSSPSATSSKLIDLPSRNLSMSVITLPPGQITELCRHTYETILYILEGRGYTEIEGEEVEWQTGDALYIPQWAWHCHQNLDNSLPVKIIACDNYPQLHHLGLALKETDSKCSGGLLFIQ